MGYRSDVRIKLTEDGYERLQKLVRTGMEQINLERRMNHECELGNVLEEADFVDHANGVVYMGWNSIKWYSLRDFSDCADIVLIEDSLREIEKEGYPFRFSRIGEEYDDIEEIVSNTENEGDLGYITIFRDFNDELNSGV